MDEADDQQALTPFWIQSNNNLRRVDRYRRRLSSLFLNSGLLLILLLLIAVFLLVFVIPSILSFTSQIFRPNLVKKSWDSLNIFLVLFAVLFGFLSLNRIDENARDGYHRTGSSNSSAEAPKSNPSTPHQWYDSSDRAVNSSYMGWLRRTSSSYPDLREASPRWVSSDDRWRFFDDTQVEGYRILDSETLRRRRSWREVEEPETRNIHVDTFVASPKEIPYISPPPPSPSPPPPPPPPPPPVGQKTKRPYPKETRPKRKLENNSEPITPPASASPPPPPPLPSSPPLSSQRHSEQKITKRDRKRHGATKDFLTSLYHKKKKKQRQKSVENFDFLLLQSQPPTPLHFQQPPPPPPLPASPLFQGLFSTINVKGKRVISVPVPSPPPPPPPPAAPRAWKPTAQVAPVTSTHKPPSPVRINSFESVDENSNSGGESPMVRIPPPPPPPPPFKTSGWKFVVHGDYVRIQSSHSSRSGSRSPDLDDVESVDTPTSVDSGGGDAAALFCPSPDVDTKADSFIAKFKAGLRLEKMNSLKKNQSLGMSKLGPGPSEI